MYWIVTRGGRYWNTTAAMFVIGRELASLFTTYEAACQVLQEQAGSYLRPVTPFK